MNNVSKSSNSNVYRNSNLMSITSITSRYNVYLGLITVLLMIVGLGLSITRPLAENAVAETTGICDRTEEVANAVVAEVQNSRVEATCDDITKDELGAVEGPPQHRTFSAPTWRLRWHDIVNRVGNRGPRPGSVEIRHIRRLGQLGHSGS